MAKSTARRQQDQPLRAALLLRVSDQRQAEADAFSLDAQRDAARALCLRRGFVVVREYVGAGESAFTREIDKRQTVRSLLADATSEVFDVLVVHDLSRYARDEELGHSVLNNLQILGIKLINASNDVDYDTPEGRLMFSMELGFSAASSRKASFHIKKSKQRKFDMGLHIGDVPFGYRKGATNKDPLTPIPEEAVAIREAFRDRVGGAGYREIARRWNAMGMKPRSKQGNHVFTHSAIQSVVENDFYAGFIHHKGERRRGIHDAIISEELFLTAQAQVRKQPSHARRPRMLAGIATCVHCDGPIWQCKSGKQLEYVYYRESSRCRERACVAEGRMWQAQLAEREVDEAIAGMGIDAEWLAQVDAEARRIPPADDGQRAKLLERKRRVTKAFMSESLGDDEWSQEIEAINDQLSRMPAVVPAALRVSKERLVSMHQVWRGMTNDEKREACRILFERVRMDTLGKQLWLHPWPEFQPLFANRREWCRPGTPGRTRTCAHGLGNHCSIL